MKLKFHTLIQPLMTTFTSILSAASRKKTEIIWAIYTIQLKSAMNISVQGSLKSLYYLAFTPQSEQKQHI